MRNSKFYGNCVYDIFLQGNSGPISGVTLENNWFAAPVGTNGQRNGSTLGFSRVPLGVTIRNNSFNGVMSLDDNGANPQFTDFVVTGNIGELLTTAAPCAASCSRTTCWRGTGCAGTTDVQRRVPYEPRRRRRAPTTTSPAGPPST